ncbi:uncharacterized protein LOC111387559 isoform X2 [Olea europaea var. sylvestris]|uniref:uncharacterized protein LOC111387559 isoform X2 n=1 Tax=Olea europaea var. sylvestris TaxID=158386 RepID=UPI000C1D89FC|nr:uncharacterized protein LOC111387559 isoform X2 [Olea europaea var. sylvestris]
MAFISAFLEIFQKPTIGDMMIELMGFMAPIWIAVFVGVLVGWAWKPKWASLKVDLIDCTAKEQESSSSSGSGMVFLQFPSIPSMNSLKLQVPSCVSSIFDFGFEKDTSSPPSIPSPDCSSSKLEKERTGLVNEDDLKDLHQLVEEKDGGPAWIQMMDRSTPNMSYQAWRRDPENGPPQYRSRTVYEDATPEMVRDFFWDDEFRAKWDDMLVHAETLEECPTTGTMMVQWVRKAVPCSSLPRRNKPRRVDVYFSSWCIRAVESKRDGQLTACEVLLFHHEDMGIPWEIAKLGIRQGMWGAVKKIDPALRAYQKHIASGASLSHCASMAQINTKVSLDTLDSLGSTSTSSEVEALDSESKPSGRNIPKFLIVGGAIVLACSLDRGLLTKAVIFGVARRFANIGRRL